jgi:hypothetical protein
MGLFPSNKIRPEEKVRQEFLEKMVGELDFPRGLLSIEKEISSVTSLDVAGNTHRRVDILAFAPAQEGLKALLLVECKACPIKVSALDQVLGYNRAIGAPFICLTNGIETRTFWFEKAKMASIPFLPSFHQLLEKL